MVSEKASVGVAKDVEGAGSHASAQTGQISIREGLAYAVAAILPPLLAFARVPLYSRWFTPKVYGEFTLVSTAAGLGSSLLLAVFSNALYRYYDKYRRAGDLQPFLASLAAGVSAVFAVIGFGMTLIWALRADRLPGTVAWAFALFIIGSLQGLLGQINRLEHKAGGFVAGRLIDPLWQLGCPAILIYLGFSGAPVIFTTVTLAGVSSVAIGATCARRQVASARPWQVQSYLLARMLRYGLPLVPLALVSWAISSSDRYMIQWFLGSESTGIYAMGYGLAWMPVSTMASALLMVMVPSVWERVNARGAAEGMALVRRVARLYLGLAVPAATGLAILGPRMVDVLLAPQYDLASRVMGPVAFAAVFGGLYSFLIKPWELHESTFQLPVYVSIGAGLSILLNLWAVRAMGLAGPAWSSLVAYGVVALLLQSQAKRRYHVSVGPDLRDVWAIGLPTVLMAGVIWTMDRWLDREGMLALTTVVAVGAFVYLAAWLPFQGEFRAWLNSRRARAQ